MAVDGKLYLEAVGFLFGILSGSCAARLLRRVWGERGRSSMPARLRHNLLVVLVMALYTASRCTELLLLANGVIGLESGGHFAAIFPGVMLLLLQSTFIMKWVGHLQEMSLVLHSAASPFGAVAAGISLGMWVAICALNGCAVAVVLTRSLPISESTWYFILGVALCVGFIINGLMFLLVAIQLWRLWRLAASGSHHVPARAQAIAAIFGIISVAQGIALLDFTVDKRKTTTRITHSQWGFATEMLVEWLGLFVILHLLLRARTAGGANPLAGGVDDSDSPFDDGLLSTQGSEGGANDAAVLSGDERGEGGERRGRQRRQSVGSNRSSSGGGAVGREEAVGLLRATVGHSESRVSDSRTIRQSRRPSAVTVAHVSFRADGSCTVPTVVLPASS